MTSDTLPPTQVFEYADEIVGQRLSQVEGVSQVIITGAEKSAVRVQVNPAALASTRLEPGGCARAAWQGRTWTRPRAAWTAATRFLRIDSNDQICDAQDYQHLILAADATACRSRLERSGTSWTAVENTLAAGWSGTKPRGAGDHFQAGRRQCDRNGGPHQAVLPQIERWIPPVGQDSRF